MAKTAITRDYTIRFAGAEPYSMGDNKYWQISVTDWFDADKHSVSADTFVDLDRQVRALAAAEGRHVSPSIQLAGKQARKPAGFDHFCRGLHVIEFVPPVAPEGWADVAV
jgi:hypothetical protein